MHTDTGKYMGLNSKVVWAEGQYLLPQHFQQLERYFEDALEARSGALRSHAWGFTELKLNRELLRLGKLTIQEAAGIFPDGTPFRMSRPDELPAPLDHAGRDLHNVEVSLALALRQPNGPASAAGIGRYQHSEIVLQDCATPEGLEDEVTIAKLRSRLLLASDPTQDYLCIPLARIVECRAGQPIVLDDRFIPTMLDVLQEDNLRDHLIRALGLLAARGDALAQAAAAGGASMAVSNTALLMLLTINRWEPIFRHWADTTPLHPETLFCGLRSLIGELSTLSGTRRPPDLGRYQHHDLQRTFTPVLEALARYLSASIRMDAIPIPLQKKMDGTSVATVSDSSLFDDATFVLAAHSQRPSDELRRHFPKQVSIGSLEKLPGLVSENLPGVSLMALPAAPGQLQPQPDWVYFSMQRDSTFYEGLKSGGVIAVNVPNRFPSLEMKLWAIRG